MSTDFLHGVETVIAETATKPIQTIRSAIIGIVGTAPDADATIFPLNTPVPVTSPGGFAKIGATGTLPDALNGIFDQGNAYVMVVRVDEGADSGATMANAVGSMADMTGVYAFRKAETLLGASPMLLGAPGLTGTRPTALTAVAVADEGAAYTVAPDVSFTGGGNATDKVMPTAHAVLGTGANAGKVTGIVVDTPGVNIDNTIVATLSGGDGANAAAGATTVASAPNPVVGAMLILARMIRAHCPVDGPNTTDADAITYRADWGDRRIYIVDPATLTLDDAGAYTVVSPLSSRVLGLIAQVDTNEGFWVSPSNHEIAGIGGLGREVDWSLSDPNSRANILNENDVTTVIRDGGWLLWGNRTASNDPTWQFLNVSRTADMIDLSIQKAHRKAVDRNITKGYYDSVVADVKAYLRQLKTKGAILGGDCWVDQDFNQPVDISAGHATFSYDFTVSTPAERVTFRSTITDKYISSIFANS